MKIFYKNFVWAIVVIFIISVLFSGFLEPKEKPVSLSLNELAQKVSAGEVKEISVNGEKIAVVLSDDKQGIAKKEVEAGIIETLKNLGVESAALQKVKLTVEDESGWQFWMRVLIPTLLHVIVIAIIFWLMFRQAKTGANQAFSFGRSTVRLSIGGKEKITFQDVAGLKEAKEELVEVVDFLKNPKKFLDMGAKIPRGVLL